MAQAQQPTSLQATSPGCVLTATGAAHEPAQPHRWPQLPAPPGVAPSPPVMVLPPPENTPNTLHLHTPLDECRVSSFWKVPGQGWKQLRLPLLGSLHAAPKLPVGVVVPYSPLAGYLKDLRSLCPDPGVGRMGGNSPRTLKSGVSTPALTDFLLQSQPQEPEIPTI